eukprot:CAMPEP_0173352624 /NCGR_PEP_ID=MMETSP1144-20121109/16125_1 /TAXON_ID=483371 /ORGANISM="non described non described, Strain CCMP2298" /LENGTH=44 /DNA_ID= /DNA_START= /DNA_END= /DNA_ORIENTATION=
MTSFSRPWKPSTERTSNCVCARLCNAPAPPAPASSTPFISTATS